MTSVSSFTMYLRNSSWTVLSQRAVTTTPLLGASAFWCAAAIRNLGSTDTKELDFYQCVMGLRVGTP